MQEYHRKRCSCCHCRINCLWRTLPPSASADHRHWFLLHSLYRWAECANFRKLWRSHNLLCRRDCLCRLRRKQNHWWINYWRELSGYFYQKEELHIRHWNLLRSYHHHNYCNNGSLLWCHHQASSHSSPCAHGWYRRWLHNILRRRGCRRLCRRWCWRR